MRRFSSSPWKIALAACLGGCSGKPPGSAGPSAEGPTAPPAAVAPAAAGLRVEVTPPQGMALWLDDVKLSSSSPFLSVALRPGAHALRVQAMGYHSVVLPLTLQAGEVLHVPISLRSRPAEATGRPPSVSLRHRPLAPEATAPEGAAAAPPEPLPEPAAAAATPPSAGDDGGATALLPEGMAPLLLQFFAEPSAVVRLGGVPMGPQATRTRHSRGRLEVGELRIAYEVTRNRVMEFTVPDDGAAWFKDGIEVKQSSVLRLSLGETSLARVGPQGGRQSVLIKRIL